jgi:hypothetical protein
MKKLFFLLVVVNLVIWLWGQREQLGRVVDRSPPVLGTLRLLDEAEVAARREAAAPPIAESPSVDAPTSPVSQAAPAAASSEVPAAEPPPVAVAMPETPPTVAAAPAPPVASPIEEPAVERVAPLADAQPATAPPENVVPTEIEPAGALDAAIAKAPPAPAEAIEPAPLTTEAQPVAVAAPVDAAPPSETPSVPEPAIAQPSVQASFLAEEPVVREPVVPAPAPEPPPVAEPSVPEPLKPAELPPAAVAAAEPTASTDEPEPLPPPVAPAVEAQTAPATAPAAPAAPREVEYLCESIGPFAERPAAVRFQAGIQAPLRGATIREERSPRAVRHWVLAPVQPSKEATSEYLTNLGQAGVKDGWRIPNGPLAGRLAVGVFQSAENARKHADMLASKGVVAEVVAPKDLEPIRVYWIDYERPADVASPSTGPAPRKVVSRACGRVAGPGGVP